MDELLAGMDQLSVDVINLQYDLEDHFEDKNLASRLNTIKSQLKYFEASFKAECGPQEERSLAGYHLLGCQNALSALNGITEESNVFDIIEALRDVYTAVRFGFDVMDE